MLPELGVLLQDKPDDTSEWVLEDPKVLAAEAEQKRRCDGVIKEFCHPKCIYVGFRDGYMTPLTQDNVVSDLIYTT